MSAFVVEKKDHILTFTFNRPEKYNALDIASYHGLAKAMYELEHDDDLRVGVILASGKHFTAGIELDQWAPVFAAGGIPQPAEGELDPFGVTGPRLSKPLLIATHGLCYTSGVELSLNCDYHFSTATTRFAQLEVKRGIYPCGGGTIRLPKVIGWGNAQRHLLTGDEWSGAQAHQWGMVHELCEREELPQKAAQLAAKIANAAPLGVQASLRSSKVARFDGEQAALNAVFDEMPTVMNSEDAAEGVASFMERRAARFKGK
ncbi:crotonase/enoyl-CoA hydratase family protein [Ferrimonas lipolytica]|uniref:Crotonase/enoyl-CoA hydratase family protein n=1 Tax=Ferrimonas lipolytica TaxID=2724191 RepID=A0A6H1UCZ6_9GAMM|nr:crotonase/enoyl-CoA hydratase family protein [Ferrimonas lipolytica]QIZ76955.1 crotonase/enoyl-CoA hydratase family protein [Ferrimonas lipolytica]